MRNLYLFLLITLFAGAAMRAQVKIGDNPQNINPSSVLELESTDKVLVITRVSTAQMNAIVPIQGALCYNTDLQSVHYYDGTQWVNIGGGGSGGPLTADAIVNTVSTIVITPTATGDNLEVAPNSIRSEQIVDGGVNGVDIQDGSIGPGKIQDNSVTQEKLSENSVGAFALDNDNIGVSAFNNDVGYLIAGDINIVSGDVGNVLETRTDGVFYNDEPLIAAINQNTDAIALDDDQSSANEIQSPTLNGTEIGLSLTAGTIDIGPLLSTAGSDDQNLETPSLNAANVLTLNIEGGNATTVDLSPLAGTGSTEVVDMTTLTGLGTGVDPFKIEPGATGQILTTSAAGVVWANAAPGGGSTEEADQTTITGVGTNVDPFKIEPGTTGQFLTTDATGVVWSTVTPGGGTTEVIDDITLSGVGTAGDPFKVKPGAANQILRTTTDGLDVAWVDLPTGAASIVDATLVGDGSSVATALGLADDAVTEAKIAPGAADQILRTANDGLSVAWVDLPTGAASIVDATLVGDGSSAATALGLADDAVTTAKILNANVTETKIAPGAADQILRTANDGLSVAWVDLPTGAASIVDATMVGDGSSAATALGLADDAVTTAKILNANVTETKIAPGAADQILRTANDGLSVAWVDLPTGAASIVDATLVGDGSSVATALGLADDAVTTAKIENATILAEDLNAMGATTDGEIIQWNTVLNAGAGGWEVAANAGHAGTPKSIFYAGADGTPAQFFNPDNGEPSFYWDYEGRTAGPNSYGTLAIGLDGGVISNDVKVHIAEQLTAGGALSYGLMLQNRTQANGRGVGMVFSVDDFTTTYGKGALVFERADTFARGDIHFLQNNDLTTVNPTWTDKAFTITRNKDIRLYGGIDIDGIGTGNVGDVLTSTGTGVEWSVGGGIGTLNQNNILLGDASNTPQKVALSTVPLSGLDDASADISMGGFQITNLAEPTADQDAATKKYVDDNAGANLFSTDLTLAANRTHDLNGNNLVLGGSGNIAFGTLPGVPQDKLDVDGQIRARNGFAATEGTNTNPGYGFFTNDDTNTGMYRVAEDQIGFSVGGFEALRIEEPSTGNTNVIINQSLELVGTLLDKDGQPGTTGQVLASTVTGTDWIDPNAPVQKGKVPAASGAAGQYTIAVTGQTTTDYIINTTVIANSTGFFIIQVLAQNTTDFTVQILEFDNVTSAFNPTNANWFYTIYNP